MSENRNAPNLWGWVIGAAAGLVAFAVLVVVGEFDLFPAGAMGTVVAGVAGLILGMPWGGGSSRPVALASGAAPLAPKPVAPVTDAAVPPAPFVSAPEAAEKPVPAPQPKVESPTSADRPSGPERLTAPRNGKADDLQEIEGIGPAMEKLVNSLGFYHFAQIASWSEGDVALVDAEMKTFRGRIARDRWVAQAKIVVGEGIEVFRQRAKTNSY